MLKRSESSIQADILCALSAIPNVLVWRNNTGATRTESGGFLRFGQPGSPDILCCAAGRFIGIEVKRAGGKMNSAQKRWRNRCESAGGLYILAIGESHTTIEEVKKLIARHPQHTASDR